METKVTRCWKKLNVKRRCYNNSSIQNFQTMIHNTDWTSLRNISDPKNAYTAFIDTFQKVHNSCFPLKSVEIKQNFSKPKPIADAAKLA